MFSTLEQNRKGGNMEEKSLAYEMLHTLKITIKIILTISIIELVIIGFMAEMI